MKDVELKLHGGIWCAHTRVLRSSCGAREADLRGPEECPRGGRTPGVPAREVLLDTSARVSPLFSLEYI